ncbi:hypothetical protein MP478_19645 [Chryseobacterium sp. WG14]|uniref:hypothetical protein n=1 Tax=unclassified Chryseobacterium TaxID=2593645 RepID=UPI00211DAEB0|nr:MULTISPECIES: hypothetical protein [unclassified Chryseobacterium]MCQ9636281.1 hypothetical protein [Chryseobacterium sp. WG23]MCQ9641600.1 hypothetical protein [Chryseobacterium sp. WG14]
MKFKKLFIAAALIASSITFAQVGIGIANPDKSAMLDVTGSNKGVLIPRISDLTTIPTPANGLLVYDLKRQALAQNIGTPASPNWVPISGNIVKFFYMPSISIDTSTTGTGRTLDLYQLYKTQFSTPKVVSAGAPAAIPFFLNASDLYYYVTDFDATVLRNVSIDANGILRYDVIGTATACSFVNIVFVIK